MTRKQAIEHIKVSVAEKGRVTHEAMRIYCENRISKSTFDKAVAKGLEHFRNGDFTNAD